MKRAALQLGLFPEERPDDLSGFSVRESSRARRLSIKVYPRGRVEVVVPKRTRPRDVQAFVDEHRDWIRRTRASFAEQHPPEPFALPQRVELPAIAASVRVFYRPRTGAKAVRFRRHGATLVLTGQVSDEQLCVAALKRWLKQVAEEAFEPRLKALSALTGQDFKRMQVRGQKTCWGSHSSSGTISINYCLLFLEPALLRYLMIHELCHARHMNHSPRYWQLVGRFEPDYRKLDRRLSESWRQVPTWVGIH